MYQVIQEPITVAGVYEAGRFRPVKFRWRRRVFTIKQICSSHDFRDGSLWLRRFSVVAEEAVYLLEFNRHQESWCLAQLWLES